MFIAIQECKNIQEKYMDQPSWYAPPKAVVLDLPKTDIPCRSAGKYVIVPTGSDLPRRCIICNEPVIGLMKSKKFSRSSPIAYVFLLLAFLPFAQPFLFFTCLLAFFGVKVATSKQVEITPGFCPKHEQIQKIRFAAFIFSSIALLITGGVLLKLQQGDKALLACCAALIILVIASFSTRTVRVRSIREEYAIFTGCKKPFLDSLEENTEPIRF